MCLNNLQRFTRSSPPKGNKIKKERRKSKKYAHTYADTSVTSMSIVSERRRGGKRRRRLRFLLRFPFLSYHRTKPWDITVISEFMLRNEPATKRVDYTRTASMCVCVCVRDWAEKSWNGTSRCEESRKRRFKSKRSEKRSRRKGEGVRRRPSPRSN